MSDTKKAHQVEPDYLAIGKLRREVTIIGQGTKAEVKAVAEDAVKDGRASEVWLGHGLRESIRGLINGLTMKAGSCMKLI